MSLHDRIMDLPKGVFAGYEYTMGYETACETSAMIAKEADELMEEMADAIIVLQWSYDPDGAVSKDSALGVACRALNKYNAWKETTK